ncbi:MULTISPECIES: TetR/AcrR family transcriptional regulator [unclassified Microbacterium]|uniref:TetR/AcrR family transcriptional regulator n=1 Tax=unclassified Microbacterium TaxID=2609290 RepID=UPI000EAAC85A|nr:MULTISPECIES: helix-turn-helix domain-containing protein [unclassified Microbacterium]MBT2486436.1 TetR/AcrR family transcriptional regulator [Microbacterium sp. ISL-108]RKN69136.1 TetR/AcrR family transcriptional regulator [Microbacterium sp. CGR2]
MDVEAKEPGTRDKILIAAATMLGENPTARLSVRAVAARAHVSTGSLRHFFPTQRDLIDTVVAAMYDLQIPDDPIAEVSLPPAERLIACLQLLLAQAGVGDRARQQWGDLYHAYVASTPPEEEAATYLALERMGRHRIEQWLEKLVDEGGIPAGSIEQRAQFLATVITGIMTERALPSAVVRVETEAETLRLAAHAVTTGWPSA